ncbi:phage tail domain-containing protein [Weissella confusa]|uniref:phage tail domain-containing protein n=1 Tax=Weissella confusa TaxID=1583 RepID=UPI0018F108DA|nr:phage tail domain-containing protein [Weissella confusa]MBJ7674012.1 phage tail family protein [Weissella confusa]
MKLFVQPYGGQEYDLTARLPSVKFLDMKSSAPQLTGDWLTIAGSDGQRLQNATYGSNQVTVSLFIKGRNMADFRLLKAELQRIFYQRGLIRLRSSQEPYKTFWVMANPTDITPILASSQGTVDLVFTNPSGMAQSLVRSDKLPDDLDSLGFGMNLPARPLSYVGTSNQFNIYNPSDVAIDPYVNHHDLVITVKGSGSFTLTNQTNGTSIKLNQAMGSGDTFVLNGVVPTLNGSTDVDTDFGHIELERGDNDIRLSGLSSANVTFSFPFLYF